MTKDQIQKKLNAMFEEFKDIEIAARGHNREVRDYIFTAKNATLWAACELGNDKLQGGE